MATTSKTLTIFEKLAKARLDFLAADVQKSGVNSHAEFEYFELKDIVPVATKILNDHGLLFVTTFPDGVPTGTLYDYDSEATLVFQSAKVEGEMLTTTGKKLMLDIQAEGAKQTYQRRYLYMQLLDIVEQDEIDKTAGKEPKKSETKASAPTTHKAPPTPVERQEIKKEVVNADGKAEPLQIDQLKKALKKLNDADSSQEEFIQNIVLKTENFTTLTKSQCTTLMQKIGQLIDEVKK